MGKWLGMDWEASGFSKEQAKKINEYAFTYVVQVNPEQSLPLFSDQEFSEEKKTKHPRNGRQSDKFR